MKTQSECLIEDKGEENGWKKIKWSPTFLLLFFCFSSAFLFAFFSFLLLFFFPFLLHAGRSVSLKSKKLKRVLPWMSNGGFFFLRGRMENAFLSPLGTGMGGKSMPECTFAWGWICRLNRYFCSEKEEKRPSIRRQWQIWRLLRKKQSESMTWKSYWNIVCIIDLAFV